ncbi:MAG: VCBS repeat-containing protein [Acidobacteria bacterium]|uniref:VCBS repeat-containing protein n=1 Tax=Candidatus Polarisedimenticola svalbardensis TaxID=2886004 RepID=A0A8J6Y1P1_9BACT|nr:VCBS repeat-containing protein [Candidatus Polarisedimenticola svalbardensis]
MSRRWAAAFLAGLLFGVPAVADEVGEPGVTLDRIDKVERVHVVVPGKLVHVALQDAGNGLKTAWFLVAPFDAPQADEEDRTDEEKERRKQLLPDCPASDRSRADRKLIRLDRDGAGSLVEVRSDLPWNSSAIHFADLHGDGRETLVLTVSPVEDETASGDYEPGFYAWDGDPASPESLLKPLLAESFLVWDHRAPGTVAASGFGELNLHRFHRESGMFRPLATVPMPLDAGVRQDRITLSAETVMPIVAQSGRVAYVTPPKPFGKTRLRTTVIRPDAGGEDQVVESWARLPEPEDMLEWHHLVLDGAPVLLVQTKTAEKLALFGEKRVRLFGLNPDRSRSGFLPLMAGESGMNLLQGGTPWILDVNQDDRNDLVIGYWKGLKNSRVVLEVFLRNEDGSFEEKPKTTAFDVEDGNRSYVAYGRDLNGDGLLDLLVSADARLLLFPGKESRNGKKLVDDEPELVLDVNLPESDQEGSVTINIGSDGASTVQSTALSIPSFKDMDGDGVAEILMVTRGTWKSPGTFTVLLLNPDH